MRTLPVPEVNWVVATAPLAARLTTWAKNCLRYAVASASLPPWARTCEYAARMFHFAEPEDAGLGVTILTPGLMRSSQPVMCSGLPLRTTMTTTDSDTRPFVG